MHSPKQVPVQSLILPGIEDKLVLPRFSAELLADRRFIMSLNGSELAELGDLVKNWQSIGRINPGVRGEGNARAYWLESGKGILYTQEKIDPKNYKITFKDSRYVDFTNNGEAVEFLGAGMNSPIPVKVGPRLDKRLGAADREELVGHLKEFMRDPATMHRGAGRCGVVRLNSGQAAVFEITEDERIFMLRGDSDVG